MRLVDPGFPFENKLALVQHFSVTVESFLRNSKLTLIVRKFTDRVKVILKSLFFNAFKFTVRISLSSPS